MLFPHKRDPCVIDFLQSASLMGDQAHYECASSVGVRFRSSSAANPKNRGRLLSSRESPCKNVNGISPSFGDIYLARDGSEVKQHDITDVDKSSTDEDMTTGLHGPLRNSEH